MKKKGLIISTVVMVLVLVAALSTATFAWFSSQATATISNVNINTTAAKGLQIGVKTTDTTVYNTGYVNGVITYTNSQFGGDNNGWGSNADFMNLRDAVGTIDHAVTRVTDQTGRYIIDCLDTNNFKHSYFGGIDLYDANADGTKVWTANDTSEAWDTAIADSGSLYGLDNVYADYVKDEYLAPTKYDAMMNPLFYRPAVVNGTGDEGTADYLALPIGVRATMDVQAIICQIKITPETTNITNDLFKPGMAAAAYINISDGNNNVLVKAYPTVVNNGGATGAGKDDPSWSYYFVVAYNDGAMVKLNVAYDLTYTIWIEGLDDMSVNESAGSGFSVDILYKYESNNDNITTTTPTALTITGGTANADGATNRDYVINSLSKNVTA